MAIAEGMAERLTLRIRRPAGYAYTVHCLCVRESEQAFYGYPGDVVYGKDDWELYSSEGLVTLEQAAAELEQAWRAGPGRRFV